jgi:hypothetical protein
MFEYDHGRRGSQIVEPTSLRTNMVYDTGRRPVDSVPLAREGHPNSGDQSRITTLVLEMLYDHTSMTCDTGLLVDEPVIVEVTRK